MVAAAYTQRALDPAAVRQRLAQLAPNVSWDGATWDRLTLFAAASQYNPTLLAARARLRSAEASARAARAGPSITVTLTAEYARNASESSPWLYGATSDVPLDGGARRAARAGAADFATLSARYDYVDAVWTVRLALRRALAERFLAARDVQIGEELEVLRTRQLTALQARFEAGEASRSELERVRADAAGDARRLTDAHARLAAARIALAEALGVSPAAIAQLPLTWDGFDAPTARDGSSGADVRARALLARADVLRAVAGYDHAELELHGEVARQWPEVHVGPGYTWERGLVKLPFSIGLVLPPLDLNRNAIAAAEARRAEAGLKLEAVIASAQSSIDAARAERVAAGQALVRVRDAELGAARRAAEQADNELDHGAIDRVDWAAAQIGWRLAMLSQVEALRRVHSADVQLEDSLRCPLEGPELAITGANTGVSGAGAEAGAGDRP